RRLLGGLFLHGLDGGGGCLFGGRLLAEATAASAFLRRPLGGAFGEPDQGFVELNVFNRSFFWQRCEHAVVADVRSIAAFEDGNRLTVVGMFSQFSQRCRGRFHAGLFEQINGGGKVDRQHVPVFRDRLIRLFMQHVWTETADAR